MSWRSEEGRTGELLSYGMSTVRDQKGATLSCRRVHCKSSLFQLRQMIRAHVGCECALGSSS